MRAWLQSKVRNFLRDQGLRITVDRDDLWTPDFDLLAKIIESTFAPSGPKTLIQIGANDGISHDPVNHLIDRFSMQALRIEPLPESFKKLQELHANNPKIRVVNAALDEYDGERAIYRVSSQDDLNRFSSISSFDRRIVEKHFARYRRHGGKIIMETVPVMTPQTLIKSYFAGNDSVDILQVDTEGYDGVIVRAFLRAGMTPKLINFEHNHLTGADDRLTLSMLRRDGYKLARYGRDTLALLEDQI